MTRLETNTYDAEFLASLREQNIFIAGPFEGSDYDIEKYEHACSSLHALGVRYVFNPINTHSFDAEGKLQVSPTTLLRRLLRELVTGSKNEQPYYDTVVLLDGWAFDKTSDALVLAANALGIECVRLREIQSAVNRAFWTDA